MPTSKTPSDAPDDRAATPAPPPAGDALMLKADALFRAALECCRQHQRYACLVEAGVPEGEQRRARTLVVLCDEQLLEVAQRYEKAATRETNHRSADWWRRANALWHTARELARRQAMSERDTRALTTADPVILTTLAVEFDLEASALLALQHAIDDYRKVRPMADLVGCRRAPA